MEKLKAQYNEVRKFSGGDDQKRKSTIRNGNLNEKKSTHLNEELGCKSPSVSDEDLSASSNVNKSQCVSE